ncbi:MAG: lipocalin family protein [Flavobacteriaceae bacterium]
MKRINQLMLFAFLVFSLVSCDDDDVTVASIIGSWEFVSSTTDGVLDPAEDCPFEITFDANTVSVKEFYGDNCEDIDTYSFDYSIDGNEITSFQDGQNYTSRIVTLSETTLIIENIDEDEVFVETYRRL